MAKQALAITHVVRQFAPSLGGLEDVVGRLAAGQAEAGHAVRVVTLDRLFTTGTRLPPSARVGAVDVVRIPYRGSTKYPLAPGVLRHLGRADIVHVHGIDFFFDALAWTRPLHRRPLVATTHGGFFHTADLAALKRIWFGTLTRASSRFYDALVACSTSDERLFAPLGHPDLRLVENGVATDRFGAASPVPAKGLVAIGRFSVNKRLDRLLDAFRALLRVDPDWRLSIFGAESDLDGDAVRRLAADRQLGEHVAVVENASDAAIAEAVAKASLFVSASDYEGFGLALVEALGAGLLPVVHANAAFRDFGERHGGLRLTDFGAPDHAAEAILAAWRDRVAGGERLVAEARARSRPFAWPDVVRRYGDVYDDVLARSGRGFTGRS